MWEAFCALNPYALNFKRSEIQKWLVDRQINCTHIDLDTGEQTNQLGVLINKCKRYAERLLRANSLADGIRNNYEGKLLEDKTGRSMEDIAKGVKALVLTLGSKGSLIYSGGERHEIPIVQAAEILDPTGCGDAYRAGLLYGIANGWDWPSTGRLGALMGSIKIEQRGAQNHAFTAQEIKDRFKREFGYSPW